MHNRRGYANHITIRGVNTMLVKNCTVTQLEEALTKVNKRFEDNVVWKQSPEYHGRQIRFTLTVKSSKGPGGRLSHTGRRVAAACWHVHGYFFDALLEIEPDAVIQTASPNRSAKFIYKDKSGMVVGNWFDWNIGSLYYPLMYSDACSCTGG